MKFNSMQQILENMKIAYLNHAQRTGRVLPEGWDMVGLHKPEPSKGAKGLATSSTMTGASTLADIDDPDYKPEPISHLNPKVMGVSVLEKYMDQFDEELGEFKEIQQKGTAREFTIAKMKRMEELKEKCSEFEIEREIHLANREKPGGSKRERTSQISEDPEGRADVESTLRQRGQKESENPTGSLEKSKPKKGDYPTLGPHGPGDLNVEGDWEGPIELFEFGESDDGWVNCTTGYYWHPALGGGIVYVSMKMNGIETGNTTMSLLREK